MLAWIRKLGTLGSQAVNALLLGGNPDQSVSSRAYTETHYRNITGGWQAAREMIDTLFGEGHCRRAYLSDLQYAREIEKVP